ncbi:hypothetical protein CPC08DRAFT_418764 [Agrocybe pediades]|nr:hypothetical protein CPC08DRAFT_418764 [Agrocybe pediades]
MVRNTRAREYADLKCELEGIKLHLGLSPSSCSFAPAPNKSCTSSIPASVPGYCVAKNLRTKILIMSIFARAIPLGMLGRHDHALGPYVYRLQDYLKTEEQ